MRIKNIELHNFGSYAGHNNFSFESASQEERVVIIGGKNGAGKTTLFTAVQVCLYGHYAFGYKSASKKYLSEIYNLINSQVRIDEKESAYLEINFQQVDNTDLFEYVIRRSWTWAQNEISEALAVWKNGHPLEEDELVNFQNYLIHLIPPDMLKLYFFDGEKIAEYFLGSKEINIREALMVLSGNDTFDILHDQVKRVLKSSEKSEGNIAQEYLEVKTDADAQLLEVMDLGTEIEALQVETEDLQAEIERHKEDYLKHGGLTLEAWAGLHSQLKSEEEKRERLNWQRKALATDTLPFLLIPELLERVLPQVEAESGHKTYQAIRGSLEKAEFTRILTEAVQEIGSGNVQENVSSLYARIRGYLLDQRWESFELLFGLSSDDESQVRSVINRVHAFDEGAFTRYQKRINASLEKSKEIRATLQRSNVEHYEEYMQTLSALEEDLKVAMLKTEHLRELLEIKRIELDELEARARAAKRAFEEQLKANSVSTISGKTLLLLEELQSSLYANLIQQVETDLNTKFKELIRKADFFSRITIDSNFNVHILRDEVISTNDLLTLLRGTSYAVAINALGATAIQELQSRYQTTSIADLRKKLHSEAYGRVTLPIEVNKDRLSSGEKQIFVMSLYWAMMNQSKNELPFIIDTPFARIDAQHRANITDHFFKKLAGQLIILSTDEELSNNHLEAMSGQISHVYMIEYGQDKRTHIQKNQYFEV